jgi:hypothetical protein
MLLLGVETVTSSLESKAEDLQTLQLSNATPGIQGRETCAPMVNIVYKIAHNYSIIHIIPTWKFQKCPVVVEKINTV